MMKSKANFPGLLEGFFSERLMQQKPASPHTIASYRDSFGICSGSPRNACTNLRLVSR
jgi:hypothetical protein